MEDRLLQVLNRMISFRKERDWEQFHNPKDMALSLVLEASEVLEHFQWKNGDEVKQYAKDHKGDLADELADTLYWVLLLAHDLGIDIFDALDKKIDKNALKYPIEKSKGIAKKYTELK